MMEIDAVNKRIIQYMVASGLSKSAFARELDVSLPLITHITSGRNKAGLDLIQRLLQRFPDIDPDWLLNGGSQMTRKAPERLDLSDIQVSLTRLKTQLEQPQEALSTVLQYHKLLIDEILHLQDLSLLLANAKSEIAALQTRIDEMKRDIELKQQD